MLQLTLPSDSGANTRRRLEASDQTIPLRVDTPQLKQSVGIHCREIRQNNKEIKTL